MNSYTQSFTAGPDHIDEWGHVNNAEWVRWVQEVGFAHWQSLASPEHLANYGWIVTRHEIDYRGNIALGDTVKAETWVDTPRGARFDRHVRFTNATGSTIVEAVTTLALIDRATGKLTRVRPEISAPFLVRT